MLRSFEKEGVTWTSLFLSTRLFEIQFGAIEVAPAVDLLGVKLGAALLNRVVRDEGGLHCSLAKSDGEGRRLKTQDGLRMNSRLSFTGMITLQYFEKYIDVETFKIHTRTNNSLN
jgi:hypothetical protein